MKPNTRAHVTVQMKRATNELRLILREPASADLRQLEGEKEAARAWLQFSLLSAPHKPLHVFNKSHLDHSSKCSQKKYTTKRPHTVHNCQQNVTSLARNFTFHHFFIYFFALYHYLLFVVSCSHPPTKASDSVLKCFEQNANLPCSPL